MTSKFIVAAASPLRAALLHALSLLKVPAQNIAEGPTMRVELANAAGSFDGILPLVATLRQEYAGDAWAQAFLGLNTPASRVASNQWVTFASRLAGGVAHPIDVETALVLSAIDKNEFLVCRDAPTIADVLLYGALSVESVRGSMAVARWATLVQSHDVGAPIARKQELFPETTATGGKTGATTAAAEGGEGVKTSTSAYVKPTAEEIEQRRLAKEKAKAEKEKEKKSAATTAGGEEGAAAPTTAAAAAPKKAAAGGNAALDSTELDIRVGKIVSIGRHPEADKLFVETIDFGTTEPQRTIVSGLVEHYAAEELQGLLVLVVCNLKPKPLKGVTSHGMVLCASNETGLRVVSPPDGTLVGERVRFGGKLSQTPPGVPSNAGTVELLSHLRTDDNGIVCWKAHHAAVSTGMVTSSLANSVVK